MASRRICSPLYLATTLTLAASHAHATHFWLNEGWTVYMERVLLQVLHDSPAARGFSYIIGYKGLVDDLEEYNDRPRYQRLVIDFAKGEDPDDAYSRVPYDKGSNLILHLGNFLLPSFPGSRS